MPSALPLIILGVAFIVIILGLRYITYVNMTKRVCSKDPNSEYCKKHYPRIINTSDNQYKHCDIVYGETPNGGIKTVICYVDNRNKTVKKQNAEKVLVRELDDKNRPVYETWTPIEEAPLKEKQEEKQA